MDMVHKVPDEIMQRVLQVLHQLPASPPLVDLIVDLRMIARNTVDARQADARQKLKDEIKLELAPKDPTPDAAAPTPPRAKPTPVAAAAAAAANGA